MSGAWNHISHCNSSVHAYGGTAKDLGCSTHRIKPRSASFYVCTCTSQCVDGSVLTIDLEGPEPPLSD